MVTEEGRRAVYISKRWRRKAGDMRKKDEG